MADIKKMPPRKTVERARTGVMVDALAKFGSLLIASGTDSHADMSTTTTAADEQGTGVVCSHGDPNASDLFPVGGEASVQEEGLAQVLMLGSTSYLRGDRVITSTTAGVGKKLEAETGLMTIYGEVDQDITTGSNPQLLSVRLNIREEVVA